MPLYLPNGMPDEIWILYCPVCDGGKRFKGSHKVKYSCRICGGEKHLKIMVLKE